MKKYLFISLCLFYCNALCQNNNESNLVKYWSYRERLNADFITEIGGVDKTGASLPASIRKDHYVIPEIDWGDGTIDLAFYIGTLALEYKMLSKNGQNTNETKRELFYAVEAINRLDLNADVYFQTSQQGWLNGFFIRTDIGLDGNGRPSLMDYKSKLNSKFTNEQTLTFPVHRQIDRISSEIYESYNAVQRLVALNIDYHQGAMSLFDYELQRTKLLALQGYPAESKDQVIHLLTGLSLICKLMQDNVTYSEGGSIKNFNDGQPYFFEEAKRIINSMIYHLHRDETFWSWIIKIPNTNTKVQRGEDAFRESIGFKNAQMRLTGLNNRSSNNFVSSFDYFIANRYWDYQHWYLTNVSLGTERSKWMSLAILGGEGHMDSQTFFWELWGDYPFYYLQAINKILNPDQAFYTSKEFYENILNLAPCDGGPYNYRIIDSNGNVTGYAYPNYWWSSRSLLVHPEARGMDAESFTGNYNGLDYMFYYMLYSYIFQNQLEPFTKATRSEEIVDYPLFNDNSPASGFGSHQSPLKIQSLNTIVANNKINNDGDVTYRAAESITLNSGFEVNGDAIFLAYVEPFECHNGLIERTINNNYSTLMKGGASQNSHLSNDNLYIEILPNPNNGNFRLYIYTEYEQSINYSISNTVGSLIKDGLEIPVNVGENFIPIDISDQQNGVYFCRLLTPTTQKTIKIIKANSF